MISTFLAHQRYPPVYMAAKKGYCDAVTCLMLHPEHKQRLDAFNEEGETPLMIATINRDFDMMELLLAHGAAINMVTVVRCKSYSFSED